MTAAPALDGIRVIAAAERAAGRVCADLLCSLGAGIVDAGPADILLAAPGGRFDIDPAETIRCDISAAGAGAPACLPPDLPEVLLQAMGGMMSATGEADGPPLMVGVPLLDIFAGINAATASLAALRLRERGAPAPPIDGTLVDTNAALLGTFVAFVMSGTRTAGFRDGCRHPICAPWNAYPTRDGRVMLCSTSDAHWRRLLDLIGATERSDLRFADMAGRARHVGAVDALVAGWTAGLSTAAAVNALIAAGIPAGPIRTPADIIAGPGKALLERVAGPDGEPVRRCRSPLRLTAGPRGTRGPTGAGPLPLSGVRILEVGPFTAGPLAGRLLSDLGADVVKVEPPGGEVSRAWTPRMGSDSGYFANYNAGKRSIALDIADPADRLVFGRLAGAADVILQNLKTGALEKLGFGSADMLRRHPGLVYCSISGYGAEGSRAPALDTVIQASGGLMAMVEAGDRPCKVGFSVADLVAAHLAALAVVAALRQRDRTGEGVEIDLSMFHAVFWLTQIAGSVAPGGFCRLPAADGWLVAAAEQAVVREWVGPAGATMPAAELLERLRAGGIAAARVRELDEVLGDPLLTRRHMLFRTTAPDGAPVTLHGAPFGLTVTPTRIGPLIGPVDSGRAAVLRDWLHETPP